ncbi:MAG: polyprenyl synthetase family protein, partial [Thermodesulfovibrionales bacterium]|nr:polyprenyl synthetase family protein [Thermodesulfovibrionales bacterium]
MLLDDIFKLYEHDLEIVEERIRDLFNSPVLTIPLIGKYILDGGGKRLRPLILLLSSDLAGYHGDARFTLAGIVESIHTASLLHDDVIDGADIRRGKSPAHAVWGNQIVILVGDFLYSNALRLAVMQKSQKIMEALSEATTRMTEGEILQLAKTADPDITEEEYLSIVSAKTAVLISAACRIGAILGSLPRKKEDALARFGMKAGIAFQMADDILDYMADEGELGKRLGKDLKEGKITLPLLYLLKTASEKETEEVKSIIRGPFKISGLRKILRLFQKYNSIELSLQRAQDLITDAKNELSVFPDSRSREGLLAVADYTLQRRK